MCVVSRPSGNMVSETIDQPKEANFFLQFHLKLFKNK